MGPSQELADNPSEVLPSVESLETDLCVIQETIKSTDGGSYNIRKVQISQKTLETQTNLLRIIVKTVQKLMSLPPSLFITYNKVWFEGPLTEVCERLVDADEEINEGSTPLDSINEVKTKSDSLPIFPAHQAPTFLCISIKTENSFVNLEEWLKDRKELVLYEGQIIYFLQQILSALLILAEKAVTSTLSIRDIYVSPCFAQNIFPTIKFKMLDINNVETSLLSICRIANDDDNLPLTHSKTENGLHFIVQTFADHIQQVSDNNSRDEVVNPTETLELIKEMINSDETIDTYKQLLAIKVEKIKEKYSKTVLLGLTEPIKNFFGREHDLSTLLQLVSNNDSVNNSIIILHGPCGSGKSELINQLAHAFTRACKGNSLLCLNASSVDTLTTSIITFATHPSLNVSTRDYMGNPRGIRNIFSDMLQCFFDKKLLVVFENVETPSEELLDIIKVFKQTVTSEESSPASCSGQNLLIVTRNPSWSNSTSSEYTQTSLSTLNLNESVQVLKPCLIILQESELEAAKALTEKLNHVPLSLNLLSSFIKHYNIEVSSDNTNIYKCILELLQNFKDGHQEIENFNPTLGPNSLVYYFVLSKLYGLLTEEDKQITRNILYILQYIDGSCGICVDILVKIMIQFDPSHNLETLENQVACSIDSLKKFGLIRIRDKTIYLPLCNQESLKEVLIHMFKPDITLNSQNLLCVLKTVLEAITLDDPPHCWKLVPHATKMWTTLTGSNPNHAKQFDSIPELIATNAKALDKFEEITHFVKRAIEIFTSAFGSANDIHVLKLKFFVAEESLLRKSRVNEAFNIFKTINEQSPTEPKDSLMLKLNSLIHLGKIHITRQEYEKAISCFQQVQILAVQKISRLNLDSEPIVLKARMLHGYAYLQQNNLEEGKKMFLQVIPLFERYSGPDASQIRGLVTEAKFYLATLLRKNGDLVNALMMQIKVLEERERILGRKHPDTWSSKQEMAMLYSSYDNHDKALLLLREVLEIQEEVLGAPSNRQSLQTMNAIAEIEAKLGNFDDALELYEAISLIEEQVLGESDEMRISSQLKQADVLVVLGQYKEAIDTFDLMLALQSSLTEENAGRMKLCEEIIAKREKADRSMEIVGNYWFGLTPDNLNNPSDLDTLAKKHEVAMELCENQDHHGALRFLREVLEDCTHLDDTNRFHLNVKADLARVLGLVGKFNESFSVYKEIIPLLDATFGECDELTMLCKDTMGQVFLFSGNQFLKRQMSNLKWFLL